MARQRGWRGAWAVAQTGRTAGNIPGKPCSAPALPLPQVATAIRVASKLTTPTQSSTLCTTLQVESTSIFDTMSFSDARITPSLHCTPTVVLREPGDGEERGAGLIARLTEGHKKWHVRSGPPWF